MTDPRFERALEKFLDAQRLSRRRFLGRAGGAALASPACDPARRVRRRRGHAAEGQEPAPKQAAAVSHPKVAIGDWTFSNWPLYMDKKVLKEFDKQYGGNVKYLEDINDNDEFYGKVRQQLAGRPADRPRHRRPHRLHGRALGPRRLRRADRQDEHPEPREPRRQPAHDRLRPEARVHAAVAVGRDRHRLQHQEDRARAQDRQGPLRPEVQGPRDDALGALRLRQHRAARRRGSTPPRRRSTRSSARSRRSTRPTSAGQFRRFTGNDYTTDLAKGNVCVVARLLRRPGPAAERQPGPALRVPEEGACSSPTT